MNFLHWWAIGIGTVALVSPIAVHFLTKPKPVAYSLSTIKFLQEIIQQRRARSRFRDLLILLLRAACIALLALALSRPLLEQPPAVSTASTNETSRVVLLDVSQSMSAGSGGITSWSQAQASGLQFLDLRSGAEANVVLVGAKPRAVFDTLSPNIASLQEAVRQAQPKAERADVRAAFDSAGKMLSTAKGGIKELVIISDFQRSNWGTLFLEQIPAGVKIQFHAVQPAVKDNVAVTAVGSTTQPIVGQNVNVEIELANYSDQEVKTSCRVELTGVQRVVDVTLPPQSVQRVSIQMPCDEAGWKYGWAKLQNNLDSLPEDDERPLAINVRQPIKVLLVSRQSETEIPSSSFYLSQALNVALAEDPTAGFDTPGTSNAATITRVHPQKSSLASWPECDVMIIDHPGSISGEITRGIAAQLRRGKGIFYVASELVDAVNIAQLADALGGDFQPPVSLHPVEAGRDRKDLFVLQMNARDRPFNALGANNANALRTVRFSGGLATQKTQAGLKDQVLAELSDTSALMYQTSVGAGQFAVLNADLSRSNWAVHPTFLPVLSELTKTLIEGRGQDQQAATGEPLVRILPASVSDQNTLSPQTLAGPPPNDSDYGRWEWSANQGCMVWNWAEPPGPGIYALDDKEQAVMLVTTSVPAIEADLKTLDEAVLTDRMTAGRSVGYSAAGAQSESSDSLWSWLIVACCIGLIAEVVALRWNRM